MVKCRWCEERSDSGDFCDELCERLYNDYWSARGSMMRYGNQQRAKRDQARKRNSVRSGGR